MPITDLPDELLHHILISCLAIPHALFLAFPESEPSPNIFAPRTCRHPHVLLVSKRFLQIGTPLLYEALYLSAPSHVAHVAELLKKNNGLGHAVRCLRLNRLAFGRGLETICFLAPNIKAIFFDLRAILHDDPIDGLIEVLAKNLVDPKTVCILGKRKVESVSTKSVVVEWALCAALERWPSVRAVHLDAYIVTGQMPACFSRSTTTLEELSVGSDLALSWLKGPYMHDLIQNSQLKCIRVRDARHKAEILELLKSPSAASERLETLIVFPEDELSYPR